MTDSIYKNLVDFLVAYASWTATPTIKQVTETVEDLLQYIKETVPDADGVILVMPPRVTNTLVDYRRRIDYEFKIYVYRTGFVGPDTGMDEYETLWEDIAACLQASTITGIDDNYCEEWTNMTNRHKDFCWGIGTITLEDWIA